ncbi:MAG: hypothetical protein RQ824_02250 [bacterium]|nr:hypothetical protein [bacterium]
MTKLKILAILIIIFGLLFIGFLFLGRKKSKKTFSRALQLEDNSSPAEACYTYALAARQGANGKDCRTKIRALWKKHGPFDFSDCLQKATAEYLGEGEEHSEGYHEVIVDYIRKTVSSNN